MTASALASLLHARRIGRGKWVAKCPSHDDRNPSLSIREGKRGVMVKCFSANCTVDQICGAIGIPVSALFYDERKREMTPEVKQHIRDRERLEVLNKRWDEAVRNSLLLPERRQWYWAKAERLLVDIRNQKEKIDPELKAQRLRVEKYEAAVRKYGEARVWDRIWERFLASPEGRAAADQYEIKETMAA